MLLLLSVILFLLSNTSADFEPCPSCGNMKVPYPLSSSDNCGNPKYKISCKDNKPEFISANGFHYTILSINPSTNKMIIEPPYIPKNTCLSADVGLGGFSLNENAPFNISTLNTVMLFNCSDNIILSPLNCTLSSPCKVFEERVSEGSGCKGTLCCSYLKDSAMTSHRIRVRVGGCTAYTSIVDFRQSDEPESWNYGIELEWLPPN